ncbi:MAG: DNA replication and repair protein RecF [Treponema sp.]|nr:DNA replication and repair protein RecF [Treponema sp.]
MLFSSLRTAAFRNLADAETFTGAKDVFLVGENGQGKTNFLEALYFCAYASSFRTTHDSCIAQNSFLQESFSQNSIFQNGQKSFSAQVKILQSVNDEILVKFETGKKSIFLNKKRITDRKELLSVAPSIIFCHEDMEFVSGSPERRRWFIDQTLSLYDPVYLDDLRRYRHVLKNRNKILHDCAAGVMSGRADQVLDALDLQFAEYGKKLMEKRIIAVEEFSEVFGRLYEEVSGIKGISVKYAGSWKFNISDLSNSNIDHIVSYLQQRRSAEMSAGISLSGPHRDRYQFVQNYSSDVSADFTVTASTGQKRLLALLLRAAQARRFSAATGLNPVLLLDDVLLEMDGEKRRRFLSVLPAYDQAFYTFLPEEPYQRYQKEDTLVYYVKEGALSLNENSR